jgi:hypothetical protein
MILLHDTYHYDQPKGEPKGVKLEGGKG